MLATGAIAMTKGDNVIAIQDLEWTDKLVRVLEEFREHNAEVTANQILVMLHVLREPGIDQTTLSDSKHMNLAGGTAARLCAVLSERGNRGMGGLGLIEIGHQPNDYRKTAQTLTKKGRTLMSNVKAIMKG